MSDKQYILDINDGLIVVLFAGAGGMCHAIERAFGRHVDIACNHNPAALAVHRINHPQTKHYICDVRELDPRQACGGRPVSLLHLSPDCTHHSQAASGQPRDDDIRSLSWVLLAWTGTVKPAIVTFENVKQVEKWGPTIAKRCKVSGRVIKIDPVTKEVVGVAAPGERVPRREQFLVPDPRREGRSWRRLTQTLNLHGYEYRNGNLVAADYGTPTSRDRLFMVAKCDGGELAWPERTHAKTPTKGLKRWRAAAECIDWSIRVPSIFTRPRPLVDATCKRIARGIVEFVLQHPNPYIVNAGVPLVVPCAHYDGSVRVHSGAEPFPTMTVNGGGYFGLAVPMVAPICQTNGGNKVTAGADPFPTMCAKTKGGHLALCAAFMAQHNGGNWADNPGHDLRKPFSTFTGRATQQQLVTAHVAHLRNNCHGQDVREPLSTITGSGNHHALINTTLGPVLTPEQEAGGLRCAAFVMRYYSTGGQWSDARMPFSTMTAKDRMALVTVWIHGWPVVIYDIGMRMFAARELFMGMGFLPSFIIDQGDFELPDGRTERRRITATVQKELCGNAVAIEPAMALLLANAPHLVRADKQRRTA